MPRQSAKALHARHEPGDEETTVLLALVVLLIETDAQGGYERHVDARRDGDAVGLLAEENVLAAEQLAVDSRHDCVCRLRECVKKGW